jgi:6-pyruvoyltetrahydropterin/6-carboxytetrahydropterin synthase
MKTIYQASVEKEVQFDTGHRVHLHGGKCRNLHGHRYRVVAGVAGEVQADGGQSESGMVIDFGTLKEALMQIHDAFDHKLVLYEKDPLYEWFENGDGYTYTHMNDADAIVGVPFIPTAENFAINIFNTLLFAGLNVAYVRVYETPTSVATYAGEWIEELETL